MSSASGRGRIRRRSAMVALLSIVMTSLFACGSDEGGTTIADGSTRVRMTAYVGSLASLPVFVAIEKGFFEQHDIDPEIVSVESGVTAAQALIGGSVDVTSTGFAELLTARSKGQDIVFVAGCTTQTVGELVYSSEEGLAREADGYPGVIQDLKGKRIGISAVGATSYFWVRYLLSEAGLDPDKDVTLVPTGAFSAARSAMKAGQLDGFFSSNPTSAQVVDAGEATVIFRFWDGERPDLFGRLPTNGLAVSGEFVESKPEVAQVVHDSVGEATEFIAGLDESSVTEVAALVSSYFEGVDGDTLTASIMEYKDLFSADISADNIEAQNVFNINTGAMTTEIPFEEAVAEFARSS